MRDLGGLPLGAGRETRFGAVVRADSIRKLSDAGWAALAEYGVRTVIDLRAEPELAADPPRELPFDVTRIPIPGNTHPVISAWPSMLEAYLAFADAFREELARAVAAVGSAEDAVVVHCHGGRDRTGLVCAFLLRLTGVEPDEIAADHGLSDDSFAPFNEEWFAAAPDEEERATRQRIAARAERTMVDVLEEVERRYGGVEEYLVGGGASQADLERARARLLP